VNLRDKTVTTLLGLLLLLVFSVIFALPIALGLAVLFYADRMFWPHVADRLARFGPPEEIFYLSLLCLLIVVAGALFLKKRYWPHK
jgi:hypothetical protein